MQINVQITGLREVSAMLDQLPDRLRDTAAQMAVNKTADKARAETTRAIRAEFNIDSARVRNSLRIRRASRKFDTIEAVLNVFGSGTKRGRSLNLVHFLEKKVTMAAWGRRKAEGTERVLRFRIKRGGKMVTIDGAFLGNNGRTVFRRIPGSVMKSRSDSKGVKYREAIEPLQVIDVPQMFTTRRINKRIMDKIAADLPVETARAIRAVIARLQA